MESPTSCVSTTSSSGEIFAHNMWNPIDEIDLAKLALSRHFALDLLCCKEGDHDICMTVHWAPLPVECVVCGTAPLPPL